MPGGSGTGFLIATRNFIMTNNHVLGSIDEAESAVAEFRFELTLDKGPDHVEPGRMTAYLQRIDELERRLAKQQLRIADALTGQRGQLQLLAANQLKAQKERLAAYQVQARFALATIYDQGAVAAVEAVEANGASR